jgi:1,4-dihydroxy-2-naphthoate octaprenyltransferase
MVPFYLGPPLALTLLVCVARPGVRLVLCSVAGVAVAMLSFHHWSEWLYWLPMVGLLGITLACAWPGRTALVAAASPGPAAAPERSGAGEPAPA